MENIPIWVINIILLLLFKMVSGRAVPTNPLPAAANDTSSHYHPIIPIGLKFKDNIFTGV
jgi:hypothetical protein